MGVIKGELVKYSDNTFEFTVVDDDGVEVTDLLGIPEESLADVLQALSRAVPEDYTMKFTLSLDLK